MDKEITIKVSDVLDLHSHMLIEHDKDIDFLRRNQQIINRKLNGVRAGQFVIFGILASFGAYFATKMIKSCPKNGKEND